MATIFLQLVAKRQPDDFFNFEPCGIAPAGYDDDDGDDDDYVYLFIIFAIIYDFCHPCRRLLEYGTLQDHIDEILAQYDEEPKPGLLLSDPSIYPLV